ncbi:MAG: hypothetical protein AAFW60_00305 [Pseudomonadota bacterium]
MGNRETITIDQAMPDHDVTVELPEPVEKTEQVASPKRDAAPVKSLEPFVDIDGLWAQYWEATRQGWAEKAVDLKQTIKDRQWANDQKTRAVTALAFEAGQRRRRLSPFVILVSRNEQFRLEHLHAGLALIDILEANNTKYARWPGEIGLTGGSTVANRAVRDSKNRRQAPTTSFKPKSIKANRSSGDGGMARMADDTRFKARVWSKFVETAESIGYELSGKSKFGDVCAEVIRTDSTIKAAVKAHVSIRISKGQIVAVSSMVAGLDAIIPMFANRK